MITNIFKKKTKKQRIKAIRKKEFKLIKLYKERKKHIYITKKMLRRKMGNSKSFTNVEEVTDDGILKLKDKNLAIIYRCEAIDLSLTNQSEQSLFYQTLSKLYKLPITIKAYKLDEKINLNINKEYYDKLIKNTSNPNRVRLLEDYRNFIDFIEDENATTSSSYYFSLIVKNKEELDKYKLDFERACNETVPKINITRIDNKLEIYKVLCNMYFSDININQLMYYDLVDLIVPSTIKETINNLKFDDKRIQLITIKSIPNFIEGGFLDNIINFPNVKASMTIKNCMNREKILNLIDGNVKALSANYNTTKSINEVTKMKEQLDCYTLLSQEINNNDEIIKEVGLVLAISGSKKEVDDVIKILKSYAREYQIKIDNASLRQYELWQCFDLTNMISSDYAMNLPTKTLASTFHCTRVFHNDFNGYLIGEDSQFNLPIFFDPFFLNSKRVSHNITLVGSTGSGKSFLMKKMILNEFSRGTKLFIFDIENEYEKLIKRNGGVYIDLSCDSLINPLQIRYIPVDENDKSDILSSHLGFLESFYNSIFEELTEKETIVLLGMTQSLYKKFGITNKTTIDELKSKTVYDYPIFTDLYNHIKDYKERLENQEELKIITNIEVILKRLVIGLDSKIFNGATTIDLSNQLIGFNIQRLSANDEQKRILNTQMLNVLTYLNDEIVTNKKINEINKLKLNNNIMIIADEFHKFINDKNPVLLNYFNQMARRLRKYKSSLFLATQSPQDLVNSSSSIRGATAIFNNSQYQFTGSLHDNDLSAVDKIYDYNKLTETQKSFLEQCQQGSFLLNITNKIRLRISVFATPLELYYMGETDKIEYLDEEVFNEETNKN